LFSVTSKKALQRQLEGFFTAQIGLQTNRYMRQQLLNQ